jgi:hypothetical protein
MEQDIVTGPNHDINMETTNEVKMQFDKFTIIDSKESHVIDDGEVTILFNLSHIISIKPIKINRPDKVIDGYWIRTTNGKKYRALSIPESLLSLLEGNTNSPFKDDEIGAENHLQ